MTDLPKTYDPAAVEPEANRVWTEEKLFHAEPTDPGDPYAIVIPPPNVTAALHLGHALNNTLQDILTRWRRMAGDNAVWLPGTDHAGIATQTVVEKRVLAEEGKRRTDFARDEFVKKIQAWKDEYEQRITQQLKAMGCSCDWDRQAFTMDEPRAKAVREAFFRLFKDGLIYRGKRLVNWDPATQTALADDEVEMEEVDGHFYYLQYPLEHGEPASAGGAPAYVTVATTRPETMLGDTAVAINPKDPRAAALRGKKVRLPIVNRVIPIIEDDYVVLPDPASDDPKAQFATGFLKVTPAHDPNDYDIGLRHKLPMINVLAPDGTISDQHGWPKEDCEAGGAEFLLGLDRFEARRAVVDWFKKNNLLEEVKPYRHSVGHSYRSHVPIEPYLSDQWYCKVTDDRLAGAALRAMARDQFERGNGPRDTGVPPVQGADGGGEPSASDTSRTQHGQDARVTTQWEGQLKFFPARYAKTFQTWHENIRDWCISRQLWWGHRIPVWTKTIASPSESFLHAARQHRGQTAVIQEKDADIIQAGGEVVGCARGIVDLETGRTLHAVCLRTSDAELEQELNQAGYQQDPDVLDTWFSSGLWPLSTLGWPETTAALEKWNPTSVLTTAREIITLWVSRMVMFNLYFRDCLPYTNVFIHAMIQDGEGRKMSKSLGNGVDPLDIISSHGADAMRFTLTLMTTQTQDVRMPVVKDEKSGKNTSPKFDIGRNFCNKVWNAVRFALMNLGEVKATEPADETKWSMADRWIVSRFNRTVAACDEALTNYRFDQYAKSCYDFFWGDLCDWYLEAIKPAMRDPARQAQTANVLAAVLDGSLRLLHPMIPFITETIWWRLNDVRPNRGLPIRLECPPSPRLIKAAWPKVGEVAEAAEALFPKLQEIIGAIRNLRNEYKADPKRRVTVSIAAPGDAARTIEANREIVELLAICTLGQVKPNLAAPDKAARATAAGCEVFVEGLVDETADRERNAKRRDELVKSIGAMKGRLANPSYVQKAPPHLVKQTQDQLAELEAELAKLG